MTPETPVKPAATEAERWAEIDRELEIWRDSLRRENEMLERLLGSLRALERKMGGVPETPPEGEPDGTDS
jgi:hypothetical protein